MEIGNNLNNSHIEIDSHMDVTTSSNSLDLSCSHVVCFNNFVSNE